MAKKMLSDCTFYFASPVGCCRSSCLVLSDSASALNTLGTVPSLVALSANMMAVTLNVLEGITHANRR